MNNDLKSRLKSLPLDPTGAFAALLKQRVGDAAARRLEKPLRSLILTMPDLLRGHQALIARPAAPSALRRVHTFLLTYLYHDRDIIPDAGNGLYGYIDDAYLVGTAYLHAARAVGPLSESRRAGEFQAKLPGWLSAVRTVLPEEAKTMDAVLEDLNRARYGSFEKAIGGAWV